MLPKSHQKRQAFSITSDRDSEALIRLQAVPCPPPPPGLTDALQVGHYRSDTLFFDIQDVIYRKAFQKES